MNISSNGNSGFNGGTPKIDPNQIRLEKLQKSLKGIDSTKQKEKLKKVAKDFEAIFLHKMLQSMQKTVSDGGLVEKGMGFKIFEDMLYEEIAKKVSETGQFGLGNSLYKNLEKTLGNESESKGGGGLIELQKNNNLLDINKKISPVDIKRNIELLKLKNKKSAYSGSGVVDNVNKYKNLIENAAMSAGVDPNLIKGIVAQESGGDPQALSSKGAGGLMQLMPDTAGEIGVKDRFNAAENVVGGVKYFKKMIQRFNGDLEKSLAAYNAGPSNVEKYGGIPPFSETQTFVNKVLKYQQLFAKSKEI